MNDKGQHFLIDIIETISHQYQISHRLTTPYNPKTNGLAERVDGIVTSILTKWLVLTRQIGIPSWLQH